MSEIKDKISPVELIDELRIAKSLTLSIQLLLDQGEHKDYKIDPIDDLNILLVRIIDHVVKKLNDL